jgi:DNA-binding transcriptional ArsR family regulator
MSSSSNTAISAASARPFDEEQVFSALANVARRKLMVALAKDGPQRVVDLVHAGKAFRPRYKVKHPGTDSTTKNLKVLMDAGIVVTLANPQDGRKPLYTLAPGLKVSIVDGLTVIDFGFLVARLSADGN